MTAATGGRSAWADEPTFEANVKPLMDEHCVECHHEGGRRPELSRFPFVGRDGEDQETIVRKIIEMVQGDRPRMPVGARRKLNQVEVQTLRDWLAQGLPASATDKEARDPIESLIPAERLARIKAALPTVTAPHLAQLLNDPRTLWYDHASMTPSYQDSLGASSNALWPDLVAASGTVISGMHDRQRHRWQFPFATTAGTDDSTNLQVANFIRLPEREGRTLSIPIWRVRRNYDRWQWMWVYPVDTVVGEVLFVVDGDRILPSEIRTRTRTPDGWATNAFRPFPTAESLAGAVKARRPDWESRSNLADLVRFLENPATLTPKTLAARAALAPTFRQEGYLDVLPDIGDPALVRELLTSTPFKASYDMVWKEDGDRKAYAAATAGGLSIVPNNYDAGLLRVTDEDCMRCHKESGRLVSEFYFDLYLYGELWGKDGIFSFHPFDESRYPELRSNDENRSIDPRLKRMGVFEEYDSRRHVAPWYPPLGPIPPQGA